MYIPQWMASNGPCMLHILHPSPLSPLPSPSYHRYSQKRFLPSNFTEVYFLNDLFFLISVVDEPIQYASKDGKSWTTITSLKYLTRSYIFLIMNCFRRKDTNLIEWMNVVTRFFIIRFDSYEEIQMLRWL